MSAVEKFSEADVIVLNSYEAEVLSRITIKTIPVIEEQLEQLKLIIDERTNKAIQVECDEDNKQEVKNLRANLTKEKKALTEQYKQALDIVIAPIEAVQTKFKDCIKGYEIADKELKQKIAVIEDVQKEAKHLVALEYFDECVTAKNIDFLTLDDVGLKITLSVTETALKKQISAFVERVAADLKMIATQADEDEILVEYKQSLDASNAITTVKERKSRIEEEKARKEKEAERIARAKEAEQAVMQAVHEQEQCSDELPFPEVAEGYMPPEMNAEPIEAPVTQPINALLKEYPVTFSARVPAKSQDEAIEKVRGLKPKLIKFLESEGLYYGKQ